jgi:ABC-type multidrug transport system fused ATPase/permease subunit
LEVASLLHIYKKLFELLQPYERRRAYMLLIVFLLAAIAETVGVVSVMPFMAVVGNPEIVQSNSYLRGVYEYLGFTSHAEFLVLLGIVVFTAVVSSLSIGAFAQWSLFRFTAMCNYRISSRLLSAYLNRPYVWFLKQHSAELGKTVLLEVDSMVGNTIIPSLNVISRSVVAVFLLSLIVVSDPIIAVVAAVLLGGMYSTIFLSVRRYLVRIGAEMYDSNELRYKVSYESVGGIKDVKVSGLEAVYLRRYRQPAGRYAHCIATHQTISAMPRYLLEAVVVGGILALVIGLLLVREQGLGSALPMISVYAFAAYRLTPAVQMVYQNLATLKVGTRVLERIHAELTSSSSENEYLTQSTGSRLSVTREIALDNVTFSYPGANRPVVESVSIRIPANTTVGFVGTTGAGKTTLLDIILGLLEPHEGRVLVDGIAITAENRRQWQRSIGYVSQAIFLADDTIAANIAFGVGPDEVDRGALEAAARAAELHDFVMSLPEGYETSVGERGVRLSGGQRQRIGIARALYRNPDVLVLDEATSALDNLTEQAVMTAVNGLSHAKTIIIVAHRLSTVRDCETIYLLNGGRVADQGDYAQLVESSPTFREMVRTADR